MTERTKKHEIGLKKENNVINGSKESKEGKMGHKKEERK